jgi:YidC/Oxa1 family membrane protein insertase
MQQKNLIAFIVVAAFLIASWWWVTNYVLEKPARPATAQKAKDNKDVAQKKDEKEVVPPKDVAKEEGKKEPQVAAGKEKDAASPAKVAVELPTQDVMLGDPKNENYYVLANIITRGAGIRSLTLPKFEKVDQNGRRVFDANGSAELLQLIEDDPIVSSFLMYHYPNPEDTEKTGGAVTTLGQRIWKVDRSSTTPELSEVVLSCDQIPGNPSLRIVKTYSLLPKQYHIGLTIEVRDQRDPKGADKKSRPFRYQLSGSHGLPIEGAWYTSIYRTPMIGILDDRGYLWRDLDETQYRIASKGGGDRVPEGPLGNSRIQYAGTATQFFTSAILPDDKQESPASGGVKVGDILAYCRATLESEEMPGFIERIDLADANAPKLFLKTKEALPQMLVFVLLPRTKLQLEQLGLVRGDEVFVNNYDPENGSGLRVATGIRTGHVRRPQLDDITVRVVSKVLDMEPGKNVVHKFLLYHGPSKVRLLADFHGNKAVAPELVERYAYELHLETLTDYRSAGPFGWFASKIMWTEVLILTTRFMHWLLYWLHELVPNYGLTIIVLTLLVRGSMFPVSRRSALLSQRMQALAPEIKKLQEKYKTDPQAKTAAVMELYRKNKVNPFGSCLPLILQMPFFLGLYYCLQESIHFRLAPFWPLWIDNLAAPDMLIRWGNGIPIISDPDNMSGSFFSFLYLGPYFNLLPVIAVTLMLLQQKMMTPPPADEQQEMQQKMMKYMFVFIGIMFYKVAAGLCVYFIVSSLWGLCERKLLPKRTAVVATAGAPAGGTGSTPAAGAAGRGGRGRGKPDKKEKKADNAVQKVKDWWSDLLKQAQKK